MKNNDTSPPETEKNDYPLARCINANTTSATTFKSYLPMQVSIAQQGGDHMYYKHTHTYKEN